LKRAFQNVPPGSSNTFKKHPMTGDEQVSNRKILTILIVMLLLPVLPMALADGAISVETDAKYYRPGEAVKIEGETTAGSNVQVTVNRTTVQLFSVKVNASAGGEFNATYTLPSDAEIGEYSIKASTATSEAETSFFVVNIDLDVLAETVIQLAENAGKEANKTINELREQGLEILPSATENYQHGVDALNDAESNLAEGKYVVAVEMAHMALVHFGNAIYSAVMSAMKQGGDEADEEVDLGQEIDRAYALLSKLNTTINHLKEDGKDTSAIEAKLVEAKTHLDEASALYDEGKLEEAIDECESAKETLEEAMMLLREMMSEVKLECMERFRERLQERLNSTEEAIEKLREYIAEAKENATMANLRGIYMRLTNLHEKILDKNFEEAMKGLEKACKDFDESLDGLDGESYGEALRWMNRLMASLQAMEGSSNKWGMWGLNTTKIDEKIERNMERIDEILEGLGENKPDDAKGIAEEGLDDMKNPGKWAHGPDNGQGHGGGSGFPWGNWWDHGVFNGHGNGKGGK